MSEDSVIRKISFPPIPSDISDEMREYLLELQVVVEEALKGSLFLDPTFETGMLGN